MKSQEVTNRTQQERDVRQMPSEPAEITTEERCLKTAKTRLYKEEADYKRTVKEYRSRGTFEARS
jgi:hypothetical protein